MHRSESEAVRYMESLKDKMELFMKIGHTSDGERFTPEEIEEQNEEAVRLLKSGMSFSATARELGLNKSSLRSRFRRNPELFELTKVDSNPTKKI